MIYIQHLFIYSIKFLTYFIIKNIFISIQTHTKKKVFIKSIAFDRIREEEKKSSEEKENEKKKREEKKNAIVFNGLDGT